MGTVSALGLSLAVFLTAGCLSNAAKAGSAPERALDADLGRSVYERDCAVCHGVGGDGAGEAAERFAVAPRDFVKGEYKFRSTGSGRLPTDSDLRQVLVRGLGGTAMVPQTHLSEAELDAVIRYTKSFHAGFDDHTPRPLKIPREASREEASLERGRRAYEDGGCATCHGDDGRGGGRAAADLSVAPADLTRRPLKWGNTPTDILRSIVTGLDGTPMPSYHLMLDDPDMWALAYYVDSLGTAPVVTEDEKLGWAVEERDPKTGRRLGVTGPVPGPGE
jgi:mono/diheme cytochrome c family protein